MYILHININYLSSALHQTMMESLADVGVESTVFVPVYDTKGVNQKYRSIQL